MTLSTKGHGERASEGSNGHRMEALGFKKDETLVVVDDIFNKYPGLHPIAMAAILDGMLYGAEFVANRQIVVQQEQGKVHK